jgi:hypothetical protein
MNYLEDSSDLKLYCTDDTYTRAWLTIQANSALRFPDVSQQTPLSISQFPHGFADVYSYEGFAFALPGTPDISTLEALSQLAFSFGKALLGNPADIRVTQASDDPAAYSEFEHVVLVGEVDDIVSAELNAQLPVPLDMETGLLSNNDLIMQSDNTEGSLAYLEAFEYGEGGIMLLITGTDPQALSNAVSTLSEPGIRQSLEGPVAVVSSGETASAYQPQDSEPVISAPSQDISITPPFETGSQSIWVLRVTAGIVGVSVIILLIALFRKNKRGEES